jgi:N-hydroxyarylamine O-acetyltransferase
MGFGVAAGPQQPVPGLQQRGLARVLRARPRCCGRAYDAAVPPAAPPPPLERALAAAYLRRLGFGEGLPATGESLRRLHRAHLERVPFENFDIHLGVAIPLDATASAEKVALRGRGGFCYELNGAFASLLSALGFEAELREARVYSPEGVLGRPLGHACLVVRLDGAELLADVGFGRGFDEPIPLVPDVAARDTAGVFFLRPAPDGELDLLLDGVPQNRIAPARRELADFAPGCDFHQRSPESRFTRDTVCSIRTPEGRVTVSGMHLIETTASGQDERDLDRDAFAGVLASRFGIAFGAAELDRLSQQPRVS